MHRIALPTALMIALATTAGAQVATYYMHQSAGPVAVPGGTSAFTIDETAPTASTPVVEAVSVSKGFTQSFPTFVAPTFAAPATLGLDFDVIVHVSANLSMGGCAEVAAAIEHVDATGMHSVLTQGSALGTIPQGENGGITGFATMAIPVSQGCDGPLADATIDAGESIAVRVSVTNWCNANRTVTLAYDATSAPVSITFAPIVPPDPAFTRSCVARCETYTSRATAKFWDTKGTCVTKCQVAARKGLVPVTNCFPPYAGTTSTCITDPRRGAEARTEVEIVRACTPAGRCPACYADRDAAAYAPGAVQRFEGMIDTFVPAIYCQLANDKPTAKCQDGNMRALAKLYASVSKCYDYCFASERRATIPPDSCRPLLVDPITTQCIAAAQSRAIISLNHVCFVPPAVAPACWGGITAADWANVVTIAQAATLEDVYCAE